MATRSLSLEHLVRQPTVAVTSPPMLVLLHGVGSNERDLFALAPYLDERLLIVSARAPRTRMAGSYAWYEVTFAPEGPTYDPAQAEEARAVVARFVEEAGDAYGADPAKVILGGFSQGAIMSASVGLTRPELAAGVVMMSGRVLPQVRPMVAPPERLAGKPFLVTHGEYDRVLPIEHGRASRELLAALPVDLTYREYPTDHTIGERNLADVAAWVTERLDGWGVDVAERPGDR